MPTFKHPPDSNVTPPLASSSHCDLGAIRTHIYIVPVAIAILVAIRLVTLRLGSRQRATKWTPSSQFRDEKPALAPDSRKDSAASYSKRDSAVRSPWEARDQRGVRLSFGRESQQPVWTAGLLPRGIEAGQCKPSGQSRAMEDIDEAKGKKDDKGSAPVGVSRGVSIGTPSVAGPRPQQNPSLSRAHPGLSEESRRGSRSPHSSSQSASPRHHSDGSDGAGEKRSKGKGPMTGHSSWAASPGSQGTGEGNQVPQFSNVFSFARSDRDAGTTDMDYLMSRHFSRPPPPAPLTPPTLDTAAYPFEDRRPSFAVSIPPGLDTSFIHQPNPDYMGGSTSADILSSSPKSDTTTSGRRSYTKSVPIGIPVPTNTSASSSTETMTSVETFSPSSYPPTSPFLPPPPPGHGLPYEYEFVGGPGGPGILDSEEEIDLHGEIISVMDDAGHGWKRHTRVYGGGVCLACLAAGEEGGFYGDKVPLEDRR